MKISKLILFFLILILSSEVFSQNNNELTIFYGFSDSSLLRKEILIGGGSKDVSNFSEFGIHYLKNIKGNLAIEIGLNFSSADITNHGAPLIPPIPDSYEKFKLFSIPIYANYTFLNYLFVNGGPILDFQSTENSFNKQSGIGYSIGFGGKYNFSHFQLFVNPNFKKHALIPFEKVNYPLRLTEFGIQFGVGYVF